LGSRTLPMTHFKNPRNRLGLIIVLSVAFLLLGGNGWALTLLVMHLLSHELRH
jgi:hypothetical protein